MPGDPDSILLGFYVRAEGLHASKGAVAIRGGGKMAKLARAIRQRSKHRVAVGDGFVPRQVDAAGQKLCGPNDLFFHAAILARRFAAAPGGGWRNLSLRTGFQPERGNSAAEISIHS